MPLRREGSSTWGAASSTQFEAVAHLVHLVLYCDDLAGEPRVVVEEGGVGEPHGDLGEVLHLDQDVHSPLQLGEPASVLGGLGSRLHRAGAGELPYLRHTLGGPCTKSISRAQHVLGLDLEVPLVFPADRYGAHPGLDRKVHVSQRASIQIALTWMRTRRISSASGISCRSSGGMPSLLTTIFAMS